MLLLRVSVETDESTSAGGFAGLNVLQKKILDIEAGRFYIEAVAELSSSIAFSVFCFRVEKMI
jgi:hypothetical protein